MNLSFKNIISYILSVTERFKTHLFIVISMSIFTSSFYPISSFLIKTILDKFSNTTNIYELLYPVIIYFIFYIFSNITWRMYHIIIDTNMTPKMKNQILNNIVEILLEKNDEFYKNNSIGNITDSIEKLGDSTAEIIKTIIKQCLEIFLLVIISIIILTKVSLPFSLLVFLWVISFILVIIMNTNTLVEISKHLATNDKKIHSRISDIISNIFSIKIFTQQKEEKEQFNQISKKSEELERSLAKKYTLIFSYYDISFLILQLIEFYLFFKLKNSQKINISDLFLVFNITTAIAEYLWRLAFEIPKIIKLYGRIARALENVLDKQHSNLKKNNNLIIQKGEVEFKNVDFSYKDGSTIFSNLSVKIEGKTKVGLVGYSGSGKTTFVNLILKLYNVKNGSIFIDNQNISELSEQSIHENISVIPQDLSLFNRSIKENIMYGNKNASLTELTEAIFESKVDEFATKFSNTYDKIVGEKGSKLSGGQKQRILIARAFLKKSPIFILDEATSQLDAITEQDIQENIYKLMKNATTIVIAHKLSTLLRMDRILVFENGRIVEDGIHKSLLQNNKLYSQLWEKQINGFLPLHET